MPAGRDGIFLLSALRNLGSTRLLGEISENLFQGDEELSAFRWLKDFVFRHRGFPDPATMARHTRIQVLRTNNKIDYYIDVARKRAIYRASLPLFGDMKDAYVSQNVLKILEAAKSMTALEREYLLTKEAQTFAEALDAVIADMRDARWAQVGHRLRGIETGYREINTATVGGWQGTDNIVLAGRIGDGKTYVLLRHAIRAWMVGNSVLFQSNEMAQLQIARRALALMSGINTRVITQGRLGSYHENKLIEHATVMKNGVPFHVVAGNFTTSTTMLRAIAEELVPDLICCDASYLLKPEKRLSSRRENLVDVADDLKRISIEVNRPLIHTVQFNRNAVKKPARSQRSREDDQSNDNSIPNDPIAHLGLHMIAETDAIAANASIVIALARVPGREDRRYYGILKGREGERGIWTINYNFDQMNFDIVTEADVEREMNDDLNYTG